MDLIDILGRGAVLAHLKAASKRQVLQEVSAAAAGPVDRPERAIFDTLLQRERLGSTGIGRGIAIPHGKILGLERITGVFARLDRPIDFESLDGEPVDLVFLLLAPEGAGADHLKALARVARVLRDPALAARLRATPDAGALYALLTEPPASHAA